MNTYKLTGEKEDIEEIVELLDLEVTERFDETDGKVDVNVLCEDDDVDEMLEVAENHNVECELV